MFYFREKELEQLERFIKSSISKAMAIYGRRRAGKTELVLHYMAEHPDQKILYFQCASFDYKVCLSDFIHALKVYSPEDTILDSLHTFRDVFRYFLPSQAISVIIIDEFPFLAKKDDTVPAEFQWIIDHALSGCKLILLGSNRSFMKSQITDAASPLYGRFDEIMEIQPFSFYEVQKLFPNFEAAVQVYGETGGVAQYVMLFKQYKDVTEATAHLFLDRNGRLFQEAGNYLMQELRDITVYASILRAIGGSDKDAGQIAGKCGMDSKGIFAYLHKLEEIGVLTIIDNSLTKQKRGAKYRICDRLLRFHYTFIEPNISLITAIGSKAGEYILGNRLQEYLGFVYEEIIRENCFAYALQHKIPFMPKTVGKWWGNVKQNGKWFESEVDLVAYDNDSIVIGECKYRNKQAGLNELMALQLKAAYIPIAGRKVYYLIASKSGFTEELEKQEAVILIERA